jgi:TonB family protein
MFGTEGDVGLRLTIDETGSVTNIGIIRSAGYEFDKAALAMAAQMKFTPARTADGCPARVAIEYKVRFRSAPTSSP